VGASCGSARRARRYRSAPHSCGYLLDGIDWRFAERTWLVAGSDRSGERAALLYGLIVTAKLNDIDRQAWLADVLARIAGHPVSRLDELLPRNWAKLTALARAA
jgi:hypothetical protein